MEILLILFLATLYLLPGIIASANHKRAQGGIWVLTILLGWSLIAWIVALIWACTADRP